jgi:hypothetical protein
MYVRVPILAVFVAVGLLAGCDTFYTLVLTAPTDTDPASDSTLVLDHRCGQVSVELQVWQGKAYDFYQRFGPTDTLTLHADSMVVTYAGRRQPVHFLKAGDVSAGTVSENGQTFVVRRSGLVRTVFEIETRLSAGDTIHVQTSGYAYCQGEPVALGSWTAVAPVDIRSPFDWLGL